MPLTAPGFTTVDNIAHTIQLALSPVFLLTGLGTLISVFSTRLARVADQVDKIAEVARSVDADHGPEEQMRLASLRQRAFALDLAVIFGSIGGVATCAAVLTLFVGALRNAGVAAALYAFFGVALICTMVSLSAFLYEMLLASKVLRIRVIREEQKAAG